LEENYQIGGQWENWILVPITVDFSSLPIYLIKIQKAEKGKKKKPAGSQ
jgi:hypothetical protein